MPLNNLEDLHKLCHYPRVQDSDLWVEGQPDIGLFFSGADQHILDYESLNLSLYCIK